jgi:hypothetical protein
VVPLASAYGVSVHGIAKEVRSRKVVGFFEYWGAPTRSGRSKLSPLPLKSS